jgi:hypothetical protein
MPDLCEQKDIRISTKTFKNVTILTFDAVNYLLNYSARI